ncbi:unnamed protein product [Camellia sinensis]
MSGEQECVERKKKKYGLENLSIGEDERKRKWSGICQVVQQNLRPKLCFSDGKHQCTDENIWIRSSCHRRNIIPLLNKPSKTKQSQ